jgi:hypothetical protein
MCQPIQEFNVFTLVCMGFGGYGLGVRESNIEKLAKRSGSRSGRLGYCR